MAQENAENAGLRYHPYLAMLSFLDEAEAIRTAGRPGATRPSIDSPDAAEFCRSAKNLVKVSSSYRSSVQDHCDRFAIASGGAARKIEPYLYDPIVVHAFGHTDLLGLVLLDDFDPIFSITTEVESAIEDIALAFCPRVDSLGLDPDVSRHLMDPHQLFGRSQQERADEGASEHSARDDESGVRGLHAFESRAPLVAVTRFKVNGLAVLSEGSLLQRALFRAIAIRIKETLDTFEKLDCMAEAEGRMPLLVHQPVADSFKDDPMPDILLDDRPRNDRQAFRCALFDTLGAAEISILMVGRNFNLAIAVTAALRGLTIGDLVEAEPRLEAVLVEQKLHTSIARACSSDAAEKLGGILRHNHVFAESYSTLGVSHQAYQDPERCPCHGYVEVQTNLDVNPGHLIEVEALIDELKTSLHDAGHPSRQMRLGPASMFHRFSVGRHDVMIVPETIHPEGLPEAATKDLRALPVTSFLRFNKALFHLLEQKGIEGKDDETGLKDISSAFVVPFPARILSKLGEHHAPMMVALRCIRDHLFSSYEAASSPTPNGRLSVRQLDDAMRRLRVPRRVRSTIQYLFQNLSNCLGDPVAFDHVLDLYEPFAALHSLLISLDRTSTKLVEDERAAEEDADRRGVAPKGIVFEKKMVTTLVGYVDALEDALKHRITLTRPQHELRDMASDFRGGLNQLVAAADVPLKAGLCLLKFFRDERQNLDPDATNNSPSIAAVTHLTFLPVTLLYEVPLERLAESQWLSRRSAQSDRPKREQFPSLHCLASIEMHVGHIFHPAGFVHYLHEAGHLIHDVVENDRSELNAYLNDLSARPDEHTGDMAGRIMASREEEQFAFLIPLLFVFEDDTELFMKYFSCAYCMQPRESFADQIEEFQNFVELLIQAFLIIDPVRTRNSRINLWSSPAGQRDDQTQPLESDEIDQALERFKAMIDAFGPYFLEFHEFWGSDQKDQYQVAAERQFRRVFPTTFWIADGVWTRAWNLRENYLQKHPANQQLREHVFEDAIRQGRVLTMNDIPPSSRPDELTFVCSLLRAYLRCCYGELSVAHRLHLERNPTGQIDYEPTTGDTRKWGKFQIETGYSGLFCADPEFRQQRLLWDVSVLKSLWDLSTREKASRLVSIIKNMT